MTWWQWLLVGWAGLLVVVVPLIARIGRAIGEGDHDMPPRVSPKTAGVTGIAFGKDRQ